MAGGRWLVAIFIAAVPAIGTTGTGSLFEDTAISNVVLRAPLDGLFRDPSDAAPVAGTIEIGQGPEAAVTCEAYGMSRLRECDIPLLHIRPAEGGPGASGINGHEALRLVTPCRTRGDRDRHIMLEYLVYSSYALLTDTALRTRLVRVRFFDTAVEKERAAGYGFFVEDIRDAAARHGLRWHDAQPRSLAELDPVQLTLMTLFQFMVGNTDWSAVRARSTEQCCHNVAVLWDDKHERGLVLPFDFDQSGVVNAPYAVPTPEFGIRSVTQRVFRGFCEHNRYLEAAIARFNEVRPEIEALFASPELPYPKDRRRALRYVGEFYEIVNDSKKLERQIVGRCR